MRAKAALLLACWAAPVLAASADPRPAAPRKLRLAVMELRPLGTEAVKAEVLSELALTEASAVGGLEVIGKSDINALLGLEKQKLMLGCGEDASCLAEIGGALGVDYLLSGSLGRLGTLYRVELRLVDARKARVLGRAGESVSGDEEKLVGAVQRGVRQLLAPIAPGGPAGGPAPTAAPAPSAPPGPPPPATTRFDGEWFVVVSCAPTERARGSRLLFPATVARGELDGRSGPAGLRGTLHLAGTIAADGAAQLVTDEGGDVRSPVTARFGDHAGKGERTEPRPCTFNFTRR